MKRICLLLIAALGLLLGPAPPRAEAFHGHHHHGGGWGHFGGGYRHWGGGYGGWGRGYGGWGGGYGYRSFYGGGFGYRPYYGLGIGLGYGGLGLGYGSYGYGGYGGYYPSYYYNSSPYFYNQSPYFYNSYYSYPSCSYTTPSINYYAAPAITVTRIVVRKAAPPAPAIAPPAPAPVAAPRATIVRSSTITDRSKARQQIKLGNAAFLAGRYADALTRYRNAAEAAPDYAEAHYRKGHAYIANGKYELAAAAFRRGLDLEPAARREGFQLDDLYGAKSAAKGVHLENLAAAALMREDVADNYFLLGLMLRFNGEHERAEKFLAKATALSPAMRTAVAALLPDARLHPVSLEIGDEI
jgi:tetratricopeptide (TPR) repeat protein